MRHQIEQYRAWPNCRDGGHVPLGRMGQLEYIGNVAAYLTTPLASYMSVAKTFGADRGED